MLSALVKNTESSSSILIQDSLDAPGSSLLRALTSLLSSRHPSVHIACLDHRPKRWNSQLKLSQDCTVTYHDFTHDHRGWIADDSAQAAAQVTDLSRFQVPGEVLVVDSLSTLVSRVGFLSAYRQLHTLNRSNVTLVCLLHEDCLADADASLPKLRRLFATCFICETFTDSKRLDLVCRHVKKGGRVVRSNETVSLGVGDWKDIAFHAVQIGKVGQVVKDAKDSGSEKVGTTPDALTTFKIELAPKEKEARDRLVLPYVSRGGGGKVFYEPDDADDWDEEDPDEDLEI